jgi:hypothetical protein
LRVLFFLRAANFDRIFERLFEELLSRGHVLHVTFDKEKLAEATGLYEDLRRRYPAQFTFEQLKRRRDRYGVLAARLRRGIDYLRYLEPEYEGAHALRERVRGRTPRVVRLLAGSPTFRGPRGRARLDAALRRVEAHVPIPDRVFRSITRNGPDVILVSPLVEVGSLQGDYLRAARVLGIPTLVPVASWDNLTNKGLIRDYPDRLVVWNDAQVDEAVRLHGVPRERIVAVGAHTYDHWFEWRVATTREEFAAMVGLDPARPFVLYVCSSSFIAPREVEFVEEWIRRLRESRDADLAEVGVLIRPHPQNFSQWDDFESPQPGGVALYPRSGAAPTDGKKKQEYYDSLFHCTAVVGINTSALIEAAIVRKPVFTITTPEFQRTQEETLHFAHLTGENGVLSVARSWDEHLQQLAAAARDPDREAERVERFLGYFVRPLGLERPAASAAVDVVEETARLAVAPEPRAESAGFRAVFEAWATFAAFRQALVGPVRRRGVLFVRALFTNPRAAATLTARFVRRRVLPAVRAPLVLFIRVVLESVRLLPLAVRRPVARVAWAAIGALPGPVRRRMTRLVVDADRRPRRRPPSLPQRPAQPVEKP